jgi:uncharacterized membrane protein YjjB (DUF3815 family)
LIAFSVNKSKVKYSIFLAVCTYLAQRISFIISILDVDAGQLWEDH